jgi:phage tail-like protein
MANGREDPLLGFNFKLEVQDKVKGYFTEIGGLSSEHEIIEHKVVDQQGRDLILKIPGRLKWGDITLKRGITSSMDIWDWRAEVEAGDMGAARRNGSVTMFDTTGAPKAKWDFTLGWPAKVSGPTFKADSNEFGVEELVIVHEGATRVKP